MFNNFYESFKKISEIVKYSNSDDLDAELDIKNNSDDTIKKLDYICNKILSDNVKDNEEFIGYMSEEEKDMTILKRETDGYIVSFDPLDGSKNILTNITIGTIYCVYKYNYKKNQLEEIVEAGYCLYGPRTVLVRTEDKEVKYYLLNEYNEYKYQKSLNLENSKSKLYAVNESNPMFDDVKDLIQYYKITGYNQRWVGSMVADCHQILCKGGIFMYVNSHKYPSGKLRLFYEVLPFCYIFKIAGGIGLDSNYREIIKNYEIIPLENQNLHSKFPVILCSNNENKKLHEYFKIRDNLNC